MDGSVATGLFTLGGVALGLAGPFVTDWAQARREESQLRKRFRALGRLTLVELVAAGSALRLAEEHQEWWTGPRLDAEWAQQRELLVTEIEDSPTAFEVMAAYKAIEIAELAREVAARAGHPLDGIWAQETIPLARKQIDTGQEAHG